MRRLPVHRLNTRTRELDLGRSKVYHLPDWHKLSHPQRVGVLRQVATMRGRDPAMAKKAVAILRAAGAQPREYEQQAAALLAWVQEPKNFYFVNESGERLQDPRVTLELGYGDCDDAVLLLCALFESIALPWRMVLSGLTPDGAKIRWIEGEGEPPEAEWAHIYAMVGTPPFRPVTWYFVEPTIRGVPLGWDVVAGDRAYLPEMTQRGGPQRVVAAAPPQPGFRPAPLPRGALHPSYRLAYGNWAVSNSSISASVGGAIAEEEETQRGARMDWFFKLGTAVATGVAVSVGTQIALDWLRGTGIWAGRGSILQRVQKVLPGPVAQEDDDDL